MSPRTHPPTLKEYREELRLFILATLYLCLPNKKKVPPPPPSFLPGWQICIPTQRMKMTTQLRFRGNEHDVYCLQRFTDRNVDSTLSTSHLWHHVWVRIICTYWCNPIPSFLHVNPSFIPILWRIPYFHSHEHKIWRTCKLLQLSVT